MYEQDWQNDIVITSPAKGVSTGAFVEIVTVESVVEVANNKELLVRGDCSFPSAKLLAACHCREGDEIYSCV